MQLRTLRPHISADLVSHDIGDVYVEENKEYAKARLDLGIVEEVTEDETKTAPAETKAKNETKVAPVQVETKAVAGQFD